VVGGLWAESVVAEVLIFAGGSALLRKVGAARLLLLGGLAGVVRWTLTALSTDLPVLLLVQLLHGLTFGGTHLAAMSFLMRSAPPALATTAQSLYTAIAWGVGLGLAMLVSGRLYEALGGAAFLVMAALALGGLLAAWALAGRWPAEPSATAGASP
jgi:PPP family 3-phenylpropionic acid transporter